MQQLLKKHESKIKFLIVGVLNTAIDFCLLFLLTKLFNFPILISNIISTSVALMFSFGVNKKFTFKYQDSEKYIFLKFIIITLIGLWIIQPIIILFINNLLNINNVINLFIGKSLATVVTLIWNYLLYSKLVFNNKK